MAEPKRILLFPLAALKWAIVDAEDFNHLVMHQWYLTADRGVSRGRRYNRSKCLYAMRSGLVDGRKQNSILMHRVILGLKQGDGLKVDHINGDGLDNRRENLRLATTSQNMHNRGPLVTSSTEAKGVWWEAGRKRWRARIVVEGKRHNLGSFSSQEEAATAYAEAAKRMLGNFAWPS